MTTNIYVFGSNLAGRHGAGTALQAVKHHGAIYGQGWGLQGSSYGIPTKDSKLRTLPLEEIHTHVLNFLMFAYFNPQFTFNVQPIGCGLAGYSPKDIAWMFYDRTPNVILPKVFLDELKGQ